MAFPVGVSVVVVNAKFHDPSGGTLDGFVDFTLSEYLTDATHNIQIPAHTVRGVVTAGVMAAVTLVATDDTDLAPTSRKYHVHESIGGHDRYYNVALPLAVTPVELADLAHVA